MLTTMLELKPRGDTNIMHSHSLKSFKYIFFLNITKEVVQHLTPLRNVLQNPNYVLPIASQSKQDKSTYSGLWATVGGQLMVGHKGIWSFDARCKH